MRVLRSKWKLGLYAFGAFGVNLLNLMVGSYLCSALIASGFGEQAIANQTFEGVDMSNIFSYCSIPTGLS